MLRQWSWAVCSVKVIFVLWHQTLTARRHFKCAVHIPRRLSQSFNSLCQYVIKCDLFSVFFDRWILWGSKAVNFFLYSNSSWNLYSFISRLILMVISPVEVLWSSGADCLNIKFKLICYKINYFWWVQLQFPSHLLLFLFTLSEYVIDRRHHVKIHFLSIKKN